MAKNYYIGMDIGGTKIAAAVLDSAGRIVVRDKINVVPKVKANQIYKEIRQLIKDVLDESGISRKLIRGIGAGVPGIVKPNHKDILITPNIDLTNFPLAQNLQRDFKVKVVLGNDVNLGTLAEKWFGVGANCQDLIGLFPGTGVGGGIIIDGKLIVGGNGAAGELGHMIIDENSPRESAGIHGSLEALASRRAIEREIWDAVKKGQKTYITQKIKVGDVIKSRLLNEALRKKDTVVVNAFNQVAHVLGKACISLRHVFNPQMIVLGGGLMEACGYYLLPRIQKISAADPFFKNIDDCKITLSRLGDDAVILGAFILLKQVHGEKIQVKQKEIKINIQNSKKILINRKVIKDNFYIRADGKIRFINSDDIKEIKNNKSLTREFVEKLCRRNPEELVLGFANKKISIDQRAKQYLAEKYIKIHELPLLDAVKLYGILRTRKAIYVHQTKNPF